MPLLSSHVALLSELPLRFSDLRTLLSGESLGYLQWSDLGLPGLRANKDDLKAIRDLLPPLGSGRFAIFHIPGFFRVFGPIFRKKVSVIPESCVAGIDFSK